MSKLILLSFLVFSTTAVGSDSVRDVNYQVDTLTPSNIVPTFENGYLVTYGRRSVAVYAPDGSLAYNITPPENGIIHNVAVDTDQTAAAAVASGDRRAGMISIFSRTGLPIGVIDTGRYVPSFVCFAPDHTIWATGRPDRQSLAKQTEFFVLRHFSRDGKELGAYFPSSSFEGDDIEKVAPNVGLSGLRAANNRIAFLVYPGFRTKALWVEADLNGKEIGRWPVDFDATPVAFTPNGAVYAWHLGGIAVLDRVTGKWNLVSVPSDGVLVGADGQALVFMIRGTPRLRWVIP